MSNASCDAIIVSCIDFRIQKHVNAWANTYLGEYNFDWMSYAGGAKDFYHVMEQIELSHNLHHIKKVVLVGHEDCGAYGDDGTEDKIKSDLVEAEKKVEAMDQDLDVEAYFLKLDGTFEEFSQTKPRFEKHS